MRHAHLPCILFSSDDPSRCDHDFIRAEHDCMVRCDYKPPMLDGTMSQTCSKDANSADVESLNSKLMAGV